MTQATLDDFEKLLEESFSKSHAVADIVEGTILRKEKDGYLVSVHGTKTEAFLPENTKLYKKFGFIFTTTDNLLKEKNDGNKRYSFLENESNVCQGES